MLDDKIPDSEFLYRGVHPNNWDFERGRPSTSTFKDSGGVSVDRDGGRARPDCISRLRNFSEGGFEAIVRITAGSCRAANTRVEYKPEDGNLYHCLVLAQDRVRINSGSILKKLRDASELVYQKQV